MLAKPGKQGVSIRCVMVGCALLWGAGLTVIVHAQQPGNEDAAKGRYRQPPTPKPTPPQLRNLLPLDVHVDNFIKVVQARNQFNVTGKGLTVAVIDTGINPQHVDFQGTGKLLQGQNFSTDGGASNIVDTDGHGSNVAGIIAGRHVRDGGMHTGVAHDASIVPLKVFPGGEFEKINQALQWVINNRDALNITVVNMSLGTGHNAQNSDSVVQDPSLPAQIQAQLTAERDLIRQLRNMNVVVVVSAGNNYFANKPNQGMGFPAICQETVSVGAIFDTSIPKNSDGTPLVTYVDGAQVFFTVPGRCTPFSQRLSADAGGAFRTDIFAPGFMVTSAGPVPNDGTDPTRTETTDDGTSQAGPVVAGIVLLLQQRYMTLTQNIGAPTNTRPPVDLIETCLREGGVNITDTIDTIGKTMSNAAPTGAQFIRLDAVGALQRMDAQFNADLAHLRAQLFKASGAEAAEKVLQEATILRKRVTVPK